MIFKETNKGSKSTFAYEYLPVKSAFWTKKFTLMHLYCIQSIEDCKDINFNFKCITEYTQISIPRARRFRYFRSSCDGIL